MEIKSEEQIAKSKMQNVRSEEQIAKGLRFYASQSTIHTLCFLLLVICSWLGGCASVGQKDTVLALVDGDPVTEGDMIYALTISHRREDLSSAGSFNLSQYVNKMIDDRIIVHDARSAGMDKLPEVISALDAFILRESVMKLREEEVLSKIKVTEEEVRESYKILSKGESPENEFDKVKGALKNRLSKQKEKEKGDECLGKLREKARIFIDKELISQDNPPEDKTGSVSGSADNRTVADANGEILTMSAFKTMKKQRLGRSGEDIVNDWIDRKLIDQEALNRHYEKLPEVGEKLKRYEDQLLKNVFVRNLVVPHVEINDEILKEYHSSHTKDFMKPGNYRVQSITVKTEEEAREIKASLMNGADFSWLAKRKSIDNASQKGGDTGWITLKELPARLHDSIDTMNPGDLTDVIRINDSAFAIFRLQEVTGAMVEDFENVRDAVYKACFNEKAKDILNQYINRLKNDANITLYDDRIQALEAKLQKQTRD